MIRILFNLFAQKPARSLIHWSLAGFIIAASVRCVSIVPDLFRRLHVAATGGGGESADWGEPLFYMVLLGIPACWVGALVALTIAFVVQRCGRSKSHLQRH